MKNESTIRSTVAFCHADIDGFRDDENKKIILHPENKKMKDIIVDECCIQGVACHIIKEL